MADCLGVVCMGPELTLFDQMKRQVFPVAPAWTGFPQEGHQGCYKKCCLGAAWRLDGTLAHSQDGGLQGCLWGLQGTILSVYGQGGLACCGSWGRKVLDTTEQLN